MEKTKATRMEGDQQKKKRRKRKSLVSDRRFVRACKEIREFLNETHIPTTEELIEAFSTFFTLKEFIENASQIIRLEAGKVVSIAEREK